MNPERNSAGAPSHSSNTGERYSSFNNFDKCVRDYSSDGAYIADVLGVGDPIEMQYSDTSSQTPCLSTFDAHSLGIKHCGLDSHTVVPDAPYNYDQELFGYRKITRESDSKTGRNDTLHNMEGATDFVLSASELEISSNVPLRSNVVGTHKEVPSSVVDVCSPVMQWRDPNLSEVISFLGNSSNSIRANAAAYLQHLCYMNDPNKQRARNLGAIPPLVKLLSSDSPEVYKNACGALRNISYGRQNDENKRAIQDAGGLYALAYLLNRSQESEVKELVTGVLWNLSSCEEIKPAIISIAVTALMRDVIKPHSGWDTVSIGDACYSTVFRNASGVLRNVSSAGEHARSALRNCENLVDCLLHVIRCAIERNNIGNKTVENCVCILRNLSYRCQEIVDPNYDKHAAINPERNISSTKTAKGENLGCFGTNKKKKDVLLKEVSYVLSPKDIPNADNINSAVTKTYEKLWQPEVVQCYLSLLQSCSNPETLEAAAGAIQNLCACYWQPSIDIRATVRKEKGLPILVELLRMEVDRVVCAVATALRNLAIDHRNKELIGKYAMRDLVQKLPSGNRKHDQNTSDDTVTAVLATINEVIKKNPEFARSLLESGGVERLMNIINIKEKYTCCVLKFACQVLYNMWQHVELRDIYRKSGWKEQDFISKGGLPQISPPNSPSNLNSTLNRPMASQGRTRYEDRTIPRVPNSQHNQDVKGSYSLSFNEITINKNDRKAI